MNVWVGAGGVYARAGQGVQGRDRPRRPRVDLKTDVYLHELQDEHASSSAAKPSAQPDGVGCANLFRAITISLLESGKILHK